MVGGLEDIKGNEEPCMAADVGPIGMEMNLKAKESPSQPLKLVLRELSFPRLIGGMSPLTCSRYIFLSPTDSEFKSQLS